MDADAARRHPVPVVSCIILSAFRRRPCPHPFGELLKSGIDQSFLVGNRVVEVSMD